MQNNEDILAGIEMNLRQILSLTDLMLETNEENTPNMLTLRDLAISGLSKILKFNN